MPRRAPARSRDGWAAHLRFRSRPCGYPAPLSHARPSRAQTGTKSQAWQGGGQAVELCGQVRSCPGSKPGRVSAPIYTSGLCLALTCRLPWRAWLVGGAHDAALRVTRSPASTRTPSRTRASRSSLDKGWEDAAGSFTVGTGLETDALIAAGIERGGRVHRLHRRRQHQHRHRADRPAALRGADGDRARSSTRCGPSGIAQQGLHTDLPDPGRDRHARERGSRGRPARRGRRCRWQRACTSSSSGPAKVGWNLARELLEKDHEVTVIEEQPAPLPDRSSRSSSTTSSTATPPSSGCWSGPGSSAPTW